MSKDEKPDAYNEALTVSDKRFIRILQLMEVGMISRHEAREILGLPALGGHGPTQVLNHEETDTAEEERWRK
jgi:hypothetical protein